MSLQIQSYRRDLSTYESNNFEKMNYGKETVQEINCSTHLTLNGTTVVGNVTCSGAITLNKCEIGGTLTCSSDHLAIEDSKIDTIRLKFSELDAISSGFDNYFRCTIGMGADFSQVIELKNSTVKHIIFEGGNGAIILNGNSEVTTSITGGKIKQ